MKEKEGMFLVHNGVVRQTPKAKVRQGIDDGSLVKGLEFAYNPRVPWGRPRSLCESCCASRRQDDRSICVDYSLGKALHRTRAIWSDSGCI